MKERRNAQPLVVRCKLVLVGDVQCGKTAMLQVLAKDCYPETYVPTVFENYTACLELDDQRVELSLWDTSGSPYYDNVRPLCYSDSDAVLLCFDISRPDIFDSGLKKWRAEILDFCPSTRILLVGCKTDLRTDVCTLMELSNQKQTPITHEQGSAMAKQLGAEAYLECSAFTSEKSIHSVFRTAALACINKLQPLAKPSPTRRLSKRLLHLPSKSELLSSTFKKEKAKSCSVIVCLDARWAVALARSFLSSASTQHLGGGVGHKLLTVSKRGTLPGGHEVEVETPTQQPTPTSNLTGKQLYKHNHNEVAHSAHQTHRHFQFHTVSAAVQDPASSSTPLLLSY
ncbi:unnamed protein product [Leuciscus chuanchicus]